MMSSRTRALSLSVAFLLPAPPASAQQSIAESVAQLRVEVANLQRGLPAALPSNPQFTLKDIELLPGHANFKLPSGIGVASIGRGADGSGGLWVYDSQGKILSMLANNASHFYGPNGKELATLGGIAGGAGGGAWLNDSQGHNVVFIGAGTTGFARLSMVRPNGTVLATMEDTTDGGWLSLNNASGKPMGTIGAGDDGGVAHFYGSNGEEVAVIGTRKGDALLGVLWAKGQDYAEAFDAVGNTDSAAFIPGSVVAASPDGNGIVLAKRACDPTVVGVLSGAGGLHPAMVVGENSDAKYPPVAISGQVYVRVLTESGAIHVGDLLVSSSTPGVAMRAADPSQATGAVIGKALQNYSAADEGSIRMLVLNR